MNDVIPHNRAKKQKTCLLPLQFQSSLKIELFIKKLYSNARDKNTII